MNLIPLVALIILTALAWVGLVLLADRLFHAYFKMRMEWGMIRLMDRHRAACEAYYREKISDEIDEMTL